MVFLGVERHLELAFEKIGMENPMQVVTQKRFRGGAIILPNASNRFIIAAKTFSQRVRSDYDKLLKHARRKGGVACGKI